MTLINENMAEQATLDWLGELRYTIGHGPQSGITENLAQSTS